MLLFTYKNSEQLITSTLLYSKIYLMFGKLLYINFDTICDTLEQIIVATSQSF